jgi:hypothetical protein
MTQGTSLLTDVHVGYPFRPPLNIRGRQILRNEKYSCVRGTFSRFILIGGAALVPGTVLADTGRPSVGPTLGKDDNNYTKLTPYVNGGAANLMNAQFVTYCAWVNAAMNSYITGHPNYKITWAGAADPFNVNLPGDLNVTTYTGWAGTAATVNGADGGSFTRPYNNAEVGGANFAFTYTPKAGSQDPKNVRFIQAYNQSFTGSNYEIRLDTPATATTPFYDEKYYAGTAANGGRLANNVSYFLDSACDTEPQLMARVPTAEGANEIDTSSDVQFQVIVAVDNGPIAGTAITDNLTLYGGLWWGYNYWNNDNIPVAVADPNVDPLNTDSEPYSVVDYSDPLSPDQSTFVPEPAGLSLLAGSIALAARRRRKA